MAIPPVATIAPSLLEQPLADGLDPVLEDPPLVGRGGLAEKDARIRQARRQPVVEDDHVARDARGAVVEHEGEEDVVRLGLDPPGPARLDEPAEHRRRRAAERGQDVELLDHVPRLALVAHHEAVAGDAAVEADQEQVAEPPPGQESWTIWQPISRR